MAGYELFDELRTAWERVFGPDPQRTVASGQSVERARLTADDHRLVLVMFELTGRASAAERYLCAQIADGAEIGLVHFDVVLRAYGISGTVRGAERVYRMAEAYAGPRLPVETRCLLVESLALRGAPAAVERWIAEFATRGEEVTASMHAARVAAYGQAHDRRGLRSAWRWMPHTLRDDPHIADAFVHAFATADDPDAAEECLGRALRVIDDLECRAALVDACVDAYERAGRLRESRGVALRRVASHRGPGPVRATSPRPHHGA